MSISFDDVKNIKKETNCGGIRLSIKINKKKSFWKMTRPKEMDMLHL